MTKAPQTTSLEPSYPDKGDWKTIQELARHLGLGRAWVQRKLAESLFEPERRVSLDQPNLPYRCYAPESQRWLVCQAKLFRKIRPIEDYVPIQQAADRLGCSRAWIQAFDQSYDGAMRIIVQRRTPTNRLVDCISPRAFRELHKARERVAPAHMANATHLSNLTGFRHSTVVTRLQHLTVEEYLGGDGRLHHYYVLAEAIAVLGFKSDHPIPSAGTWLTAHRLRVLLNRNEYWVSVRLAASNIQTSRRRLLDDCSIPRWHYPPWVLKTLQADAEAE